MWGVSMRVENNCSACGISIPFGKKKCSHCVKENVMEKNRANKTPHKLNVSDNSKITFWGYRGRF